MPRIEGLSLRVLECVDLRTDNLQALAGIYHSSSSPYNIKPSTTPAFVGIDSLLQLQDYSSKHFTVVA